MSARTQKRTFGGGDDMTKSGNDALDKILDGGMTDAYKRPWHRLERGLRLNRLRSFVADEQERCSFSEAEGIQLMTLLQKTLDKKLLNSKTTVIYDQDDEAIKEIKGLVSHRGADGILKYQFIEKRLVAGTRRKRTTEEN
jgi:hypothetical protein